VRRMPSGRLEHMSGQQKMASLGAKAEELILCTKPFRNKAYVAWS